MNLKRFLLIVFGLPILFIVMVVLSPVLIHRIRCQLKVQKILSNNSSGWFSWQKIKRETGLSTRQVMDALFILHTNKLLHTRFRDNKTVTKLKNRFWFRSPDNLLVISPHQTIYFEFKYKVGGKTKLSENGRAVIAGWLGLDWAGA